MRTFSEDLVGFGEVDEAVNDILQAGVAAYRHDRAEGERLFRAALAHNPSALPTYFCLYKILTYQGHLDQAIDAARAGMIESARQAGLAPDWARWTRAEVEGSRPLPRRFALYTLKALAFIHLKRGEADACEALLAKLAELGEIDCVGGSVIADLYRAVA